MVGRHRAALPAQLVDVIWKREINPGKVFDLVLPLDQAAQGYMAMAHRRAIKVLLDIDVANYGVQGRELTASGTA